MKPSALLAPDLTINAFAQAVMRFRIPLLIGCLVASIAMAVGASRVEFSSDYRVFFDTENPQLLAFENLQNAYQKDESILLVVAPETGSIFSPSVLSAVRSLTEAAWQLPFTTRVTSLTNFQHSEAREDDIAVDSLVPKRATITDDVIETARRVGLSEPLLVDRLVARDEKATGIYIALTLPGKKSDEVTIAIKAARDLVQKIKEHNPGLRIAITGSAALNNAFAEAAQSDQRNLFPLVYAIVLLTVLLIFPSFGAVVGMIAVVGLSTACAVGVAGWFGILLNPISAAAPLIITTVATADTVHILTSMNGRLRQGGSKIESIVYALEINFVPITLTSLTTIVGFLSLNASDAPPFHDLGNISALGVFLAWFLSVTLLPTLLALLPTGRSRFLDRFQFVQTGLSDFVIARPWVVMIGTGVIAASLIAWIPKIELNDQFVKYFSSDLQFRSDTDFTAERLTGIYDLDFSVDSGSAGGVADPTYLARVEQFANWLRAQPEVVHVNALPDLIKRLNRNMHGDDPSEERLPTNRDLAAQYLLLFEMSLPLGQDLQNLINVDRSASRLTATLKNVSTRQTQDLKVRAEDWQRNTYPTDKVAEATGPAVMFSTIYERNIRSMLVGTAIALVLISACLIAMLQDVRLGLISLIPNVLPVLMAFGVWGLVVGHVGLAAAVIAAVTLGIVVDNTVHFLSKFQQARRTREVPVDVAVRSAFSIVGPAILSTTAILICGFLVLSTSSFQANADLGLLAMLTIFFALLTDVLALPALLMMRKD
jgi:predicted RND superfamily exporter protein